QRRLRHAHLAERAAAHDEPDRRDPPRGDLPGRAGRRREGLASRHQQGDGAARIHADGGSRGRPAQHARLVPRERRDRRAVAHSGTKSAGRNSTATATPATSPGQPNGFSFRQVTYTGSGGTRAPHPSVSSFAGVKRTRSTSPNRAAAVTRSRPSTAT